VNAALSTKYDLILMVSFGFEQSEESKLIHKFSVDRSSPLI
jgi:hypothetical protein